MYKKFFTDEKGNYIHSHTFHQICEANNYDEKEVLKDATDRGFTFHPILNMPLQVWIDMAYPTKAMERNNDT